MSSKTGRKKYKKEEIKMKTKRGLFKKIGLNKKTIANLDNRDLHKVNGGWTGPTEVTVCMTNCVSNCPTCQGSIRTCP
jgi:hypothetical protein